VAPAPSHKAALVLAAAATLWLAALSGCTSPGSGTAATEPVAAAGGGAAGTGADYDGEYEFESEIVDSDGVALDVPVTISRDRGLAHVDVDGEVHELRWNGEEADCDCRNFASDAYELYVRFPDARHEGEAVLSRVGDVGATETVVALLEESDGLEIKVNVVVPEERESVTFLYEGEPEVLAWDKKEDAACRCRRFANQHFAATIAWPASGRATATIKALAGTADGAAP
jgi:hypothetical protein